MSTSASNASEETARGAPAIRCRGLVKRYGAVTALSGLDLEVRAGECFGLLGPNGAGKTTTVEICEGLLTPTAGEVEVLGRSWAHEPGALRDRIGVALQETQLPDKLTVDEVVRLFASFYASARPTKQVADRVIAELSLIDKRGSYISRLSGGQKQRVAIACALVADPEILFLDEPTTGLDPQSRRQVWELVQRYKDRGRTVILTTHYMDEAERLCDRVAIVDQGRVIALGSPAALIETLGGAHIVEFDATTATDRPLEAAALAALPGISAARLTPSGAALTVTELHLALPSLLAHLRGLGASDLTRLETHHASLEDVFVSLTGRHLRDA